ncbi:MAG: hypothetical protein JNL42_21160 [Anaerolineae bacterium]|nr:hypothetical protein [Anaerolineae bacterium]
MAGQNGIPTDVSELKTDLKDVVDQAAAEASELARELHHKADDVRKGMVKSLNESALKLREQARQGDAGADAQKTADEVAKQMERAASYLSTHSVEDIRKDAEQTVRKNSTLILAIVLIVGVVIGLILRGSDRD